MTTDYEVNGTLKLAQPRPLPDLLDTLIVGGGPAGTAAAFRARELGLNALVIDFDDLLKRIRDYPKDKLILPNFGGGDAMRFPAGDDCVASLRFEPIDKDDMCATWKALYRTFNVPAKIGVELTGLERAGDEAWLATAWNHRTREQEEYRARSVVLALGRGVPRRFDIPGNTDGILYGLDNPERHMDGPVCVIGGGTSAAEAVIGISAAKVAAEDECPVYWSYRGSKMPRVSKALAEAFFEAYVGNGNIRYFPHSEPVAVVTAPDRSEHLSILVDRKSAPGRAPESVHLEFPKEHCIACIGEDIPESFLREVGIRMVTWGGKSKKMMALTSLLESQQPDIYVIGDLLSQAYLETEDFDSPPDGYRQVKHRGNIKSSLRDGVFVAEVVKQRLEGRAREDVRVVMEDAAPAVAVSEDMGALELGSEPDEPPEEEVPGTHASLVLLTPTGVEAEEFALNRTGATTIGRQGCDIEFPNDTLLAESHASVAFREDDYFLRDDGSRSGTYLRVRPGHPVRLAVGDLIRLGRQILVVHEDDGSPFVQHYDASGQALGRHAIEEGATIFGRVTADAGSSVVLDPDDLTLSRLHMAVTRKGAALTLEDRSRNGTYVKISVERRLEHGDLFRVGNQQLEVRWSDRELPQKKGSEPIASAPAASVTFADQGIGGPIDPEQSLVAWAEQNDVEIEASCWMGVCGVDPIRVIEGAEHLNEPDEQECKTLEQKGLDPGSCRLACMTKAAGPVIVEVVK